MADSSRQSRKRTWSFRIASLTLAVVLCELALQGVSKLSARVNIALAPPHKRAELARSKAAVIVPDDVLGYRGNPGHPEHDRLGFHNAAVPESADIIALGDSQTYGPFGPPRETWPGALGERLGVGVYNMGFGGWGPVEELAIIDEAIDWNPSTIILGFYFGNDLFDAYRAVHEHHRLEELATPGVSRAIEEANRAGQLGDEVFRLFLLHGGNQPIPPTEGLFPRIKAGISLHSKLYGAARGIKELLGESARTAQAVEREEDDLWRHQVRWASRHPDRGVTIRRGAIRTLLTPARRHRVLDLQDPRIAEGLAITLKALDQCQAKCRAAGIDFRVVLIPTKETVFHPLMAKDQRHADLDALVRSETEARNEIIAFLKRSEIPFVDATPSLRKCFGLNQQPYPITRDGHPNATGYAQIAEAASILIDRSITAKRTDSASLASGK